MATNYETSVFKSTVIELDDSSFIDCVFEDCELIYSARGPVRLEQCSFVDCKWSFRGAASDTVNFMKALIADFGPAGERMILETFGLAKF